MAKERFAKNISIKNRKASFQYEFLDTYQAGIVLRGTEIKSIREGKVNLTDAYCYFKSNELFVSGMHISPYTQGGHYNHEATRTRKLLLNRKELEKLEKKAEEKGLTIIISRIYINDRGLAKVQVVLAKGKKLFDKRQSLKEKDAKREMAKIKS
ncbi:MAG: SsrA-binding protein SmpB [Cyclobacteriaceae bacterium]|nr:SsrA-binding protein SmpB [Cyclobacteriaceae bacterium]MCH8517240.1 SsrA-binding protein SmpB [Cyclobacteriaceae bacterium]